jgi:hypothetical protein
LVCCTKTNLATLQAAATHVTRSTKQVNQYFFPARGREREMQGEDSDKKLMHFYGQKIAKKSTRETQFLMAFSPIKLACNFFRKVLFVVVMVLTVGGCLLLHAIDFYREK